MTEKKSIVDASFNRLISYYKSVVTDSIGIQCKAPGYYLSLFVVIGFSIAFLMSFFLMLSGQKIMFVVPCLLVAGMVFFALWAKKKYSQKI